MYVCVVLNILGVTPAGEGEKDEKNKKTEIKKLSRREIQKKTDKLFKRYLIEFLKKDILKMNEMVHQWFLFVFCLFFVVFLD